jgi:type VII secretion integral membrane protein EccD
MRGAGGALVLAILFVIIVISRARAFTDRRQAVALVCGAAAAVCAAVVRYAVHAHGQSAAVLLWGAVVLLGFASAGLAAALLVPVTRFTPLVRMAAEWLELVAIVVALPLAAWIGGLFTWVRMR